MRVGINSISALRLGAIDVQAAYLGASQVFSRFTPAVLFANGEQGAWFEPDPTTTFTDTAGTTSAGVGDAVALMLDESGNGHNATQPTAAARPILRQAGTGEYYLEFDGVDDFMSTPSIDFTGTDKMSVFAGVRKLSDAQIAYIVATNGGLVGTMQLRAPGSSTADYRAVYRGNTATVASVAAGFAAPISNVVTAIADSSVPSVTIKVDAGTPSTSGADPGTGIFSAGQMLIGSVTSGAGFFNGQIFSILVRGALTDTDAIERTEKYVANRTAGVTL